MQIAALSVSHYGRTSLTCGNTRAGEGNRTPNLPITSRMRCQLRHAGERAGLFLPLVSRT
jgi:hypothetical protein